MEILGIGPLELLFIVLIALIVLGPKDMVKAGKTIGRTLRTIVSSDTWRIVNQASREVRNLPNRLIREAGIDDLQKQLPTQREIEKSLGIDEINKSIQASIPKEFQPTTPPASVSTPGGQNTAEADLSPWTTSPQTIAPPHLSEGTVVEEETPAEASENAPFSSSEKSEENTSEGGAEPG
jgi:sec-independent protein translocase protein TatB